MDLHKFLKFHFVCKRSTRTIVQRGTYESYRRTLRSYANNLHKAKYNAERTAVCSPDSALNFVERHHLISKFCKREVELPIYEVCIYKPHILQFALTQIHLSILTILLYLKSNTLQNKVYIYTNAIANFKSHNLYIIIFNAPFSLFNSWILAIGHGVEMRCHPFDGYNAS